MIYFIKNKADAVIKIGYSKNAKKRLANLQTANPHELVLLGTIQGGLEHEAALHERFARSMLQGEWFRGDILGEVMAIIAKEAASPAQPKTNVIVSGDCDRFFVRSSDPAKMVEEQGCKRLCFRDWPNYTGRHPLLG